MRHKNFVSSESLQHFYSPHETRGLGTPLTLKKALKFRQISLILALADVKRKVCFKLKNLFCIDQVCYQDKKKSLDIWDDYKAIKITKYKNLRDKNASISRKNKQES